MAFTKSTKDMNIIAGLADEPNITDGLTPAQLKAKFDEGDLSLQTTLNNLIDALHSIVSGSSGAENIGSTAIAGLTGTTVHAQLSNLLAVAQEAAAGTIPEGSIEDVKLSATAGQIKDRVANHVADNLYQVAGGTATALTLTIATTLVDGFPVNFIASADNGGAASTINTKNLYKAGGTDAVTLIKDKPYTAVYNSAGDCFFLKASAIGDVTVADVLAGKTFSNDSDTGLTGTMTNNGAVTVTPTTSNQFIAEGFHNGSGYVKGDLDLVAGNIKKDVNIFGVVGTHKGNFAKGTGTTSGGVATVSGLSFTPAYVIIEVFDGSSTYYRTSYFADTYLTISKFEKYGTKKVSSTFSNYTNTDEFTVTSDGFTVQLTSTGNYAFKYFACEAV